LEGNKKSNMFTVVVILIILLCILLSLVVLAQAAKGHGLAGGLGAPGGVGTMFGVRRASDFLVKATIFIAAAFMLLSLVANRVFLPSSGVTNIMREGAPVQSNLPSAPGPGTAPAPSGTAPAPQAPPPPPAK
jgi:preprotein translocase subunit SecG